MTESVRFAVCVNNDGYPASLELHKIYRVLPDERAESDGAPRVIDERGEDYLYPAEYFAFVDLSQAVEKSLLEKAYIELLERSLNAALPSELLSNH